MSLSIRVAVIALAVAGFSGVASAQAYYPPPPGYYPPPPPGYYPPRPGYYPRSADYDAPVPPADVAGPPAGPYYGDGMEEAGQEYPPQSAPGHPPRYAPGYPPQDSAGYSPEYPPQYPQPYPPERPAYAAPVDRSAAQTPAYVNGEPAPRPPGFVGGGAAPADVTGSVGGQATAPGAPDRGATVAGLPPEDQPEHGSAPNIPDQFRRKLVDYVTTEPAGTVIIDTPNTYLYLVLGRGKALRYGVGVGREGFTWSGTERVSRMSEWPDWHPPKEMIERQPYLPRFMAGGEGNPLGARALYLGNTVYRIHGTNQPSTIGHFVSSGCIRLTNEDITDLYSRVNVGTRIVVLAGSPAVAASTPGRAAR